jgi:hypothetical protein
MRSPRLIIAILAMLLVSVAQAPATANFTGDSVNVQWLAPTTSSPLMDLGTQTITSAGNDYLFMGGSSTITVTPDAIEIAKNTYGSGTFSEAGFNGFAFQDLTNALIAGVTVDSSTSLSGFDSSRVTFTDDTIWVNLQGLTFVSGSSVMLDVSFADAVPEPAYYQLGALLAFGGLGALRLRKRA